ncbi:universal stress protein [Arenibacter certesii]|uniref:Universal stress protein UspA n=1 Tax=Arenibacter certesii TaxID=228955 RepID=A0A918ITP9_9FLAO|nr:universal stress protein [Arenibacter certesii]GGW29420.1 universal stress protein UspA [Arenibacter certesii]
MKNILVATDFSENCFNALKYSVKLFQEFRCTFYILHVNPLSTYTNTVNKTSKIPSETRANEGALEDSREQLRSLVKKIGAMFPNRNHTYVPIAIHDYFVDAIKREVINRNIDLIVMGCKGITGINEVAIGTNTSDVITKVKCSLLAVPEKACYSTLKEIAFPTDYHLGYEINVLENLLGIAQINKSALRIVNFSKNKDPLSEEQLTNKEFLADYFKDLEHDFYYLTGSKLETAIESFAETKEIDMIAMVAKNLNFLQRILFKPAVEEISYHIKLPFLVLHEKLPSNMRWPALSRPSQLAH